MSVVHSTGPLIMTPCSTDIWMRSSSKVDAMSPDHRAAEWRHEPAHAERGSTK